MPTTPHLPRAEVIATVLARLDDEHGRDGGDGAAARLRANGLDDATPDRLRARLTGRDRLSRRSPTVERVVARRPRLRVTVME